MANGEPILPAMSYEQRRQLLALLWAATGTGVVVARLTDALGVSLPTESIVESVVDVAAEILDKELS